MDELLRKARDRRKLTNAQISRMLNVSESYICKIMTGARSPLPILEELCQLLGIPLRDMDVAPKRTKVS